MQGCLARKTRSGTSAQKTNGSIAESWRNVRSLEWVQPLALAGKGLLTEIRARAWWTRVQDTPYQPSARERPRGSQASLGGEWRSPAVTSIPCTTVSCERSHGWGAAHRSISTANLWPRVSARAEGRCARRWWFRELGLGPGSGGGLGHRRL